MATDQATPAPGSSMWGWSQLHGLLPSTTIPSAARFCVAGPTAEDHFRPPWGAPHPATMSGVSICSSFAETQEDLVAPLAADLETHLPYLCRPWQFFIDTPRAAYIALLCAPMPLLDDAGDVAAFLSLLEPQQYAAERVTRGKQPDIVWYGTRATVHGRPHADQAHAVCAKTCAAREETPRVTRREHEFPCSVCLLESDRPRLQRQILALWFLWCAFYAALRCVGVTSRAHVQRITACSSPIEPRHWLRLLLLLLLSPHVHGMETEPATARLEPLEAALAALMATVAALATLAPEHVRSSLQEVETRLGTIAAVVTSPHGSTYGSTPSSSSSDMSSDGGTSAPAETRVSPGTVLPATGLATRLRTVGSPWASSSLTPAAACLFMSSGYDSGSGSAPLATTLGSDGLPLPSHTSPSLRGGMLVRTTTRSTVPPASHRIAPRDRRVHPAPDRRGSSSRHYSSSDSGARRSQRQTDRSSAYAASRDAARRMELQSALRRWRTAAHAVRRNAVESALASAPPSDWHALLFACRLRLRVRRRRLLSRCAAILSPPLHVRFVRKLRLLASRRRHVLGLLQMNPRPMPAYDVGYDADTGVFSFRDPCGRLSYRHPAVGSAVHIPAFSSDGSIVPPLSPSPSCSIVLCPEATGAWCYYDTATGAAYWFPPADSTPLQSRLLRMTAGVVPAEAPPRLHYQVTAGALGLTESTRDMLPVYRDCGRPMLIAHRTTGAVREAPWIALRTSTGVVYYANLATRLTRWHPPHLWMEGWVSRVALHPSDNCSTSLSFAPADVASALFLGDRPFDSRALLPPQIARQRVEGGAPHLHERGCPQYPSDEYDTDLSYPLDAAVACPPQAASPVELVPTLETSSSSSVPDTSDDYDSEDDSEAEEREEYIYWHQRQFAFARFRRAVSLAAALSKPLTSSRRRRARRRRSGL